MVQHLLDDSNINLEDEITKAMNQNRGMEEEEEEKNEQEEV